MSEQFAAGGVCLLDRGCDGDAALEAWLLAGEEGHVLCLGPPPEIPGWRQRLRRGRREAGTPLPVTGAGANRVSGLVEGQPAICWSVAAAWSLSGLLADAPTRLAIRLVAPPDEHDQQLLAALGGKTQVLLACMGESVASAMRTGGVPGRVCVIPPPAAAAPPDAHERRRLRQRLGVRAGEIVLLAPGQVHARSGHRLAIWATAILSVMELPVRLVFQHTGQAARDMANFARESGFGQEVILAGSELEQGELLGAADLAVFLGRDGVPGPALATAASMGLPIVAGEIPAAGDWLADGRTALLVPPDRPQAIAGALWRLIHQQPLVAALGAAAKAMAQARFDLQAVRARWRDLLAASSPTADGGGAGLPPARGD